MKTIISIAAVILLTSALVTAQKTNDAISTQLKSLKADKKITLSYDADSDTSKIMVRADNFDDKETSKAGLQAMNFGMAFFYQGKTLATPPETINLTFWVLTKKPQFAAANNFTVTLAKETLDLGAARYAAKPGDKMEYLNFKISRTNLARIAAAGSNVKFKLGTNDFTFTPEHLTIFKNLLTISDSH